MPFPNDEVLMKTATDLVAGFRAVFGNHPGFRPAHAKGIMVHGTFSPTPEAAKLSSAQHFTEPSTPVLIRFSDSTGLPNIPDADPNASPRGIAIRFDLGPHKHTDIIGHSTPFFPTRTGAEFLQFLQALATSPPGTPSPTPVEQFLGSHPGALAFVTAPKPTPTSLVREEYYSVSAFKLIDHNGKATFVRYTIAPVLGKESVEAETLKDKSPVFLHEELAQRLGKGPAKFRLLVQVAEDGDITDDATIHWPASRKSVDLGMIEVERLVGDDAAEQKQIIYDPIPRVAGVEPSDDPLLEMRAAVYLLGGRERRAAP